MAQRMRALRSRFGGLCASARNPCRRGLHSYKAATRESTCGMRKNEKFAEALRFFILGDMHVLSGCHISEAWQRDERAAGSTRVLARYPGSRRGDEPICWPGRCPGFACPDASRAVTRTCRDVSLSGPLDRVALSPACGRQIERRRTRSISAPQAFVAAAVALS
jgi:hypothetical protein